MKWMNIMNTQPLQHKSMVELEHTNQTRTGNGYVFSDSFIDADTAHMEMEKYYGHKLILVSILNLIQVD